MSTPESEAGVPGVQGEGAGELLAQLSFDVMGRLSRLASEEDMSLTHLRMLAILRDRKLRMADLAVALGVDRSSVSGLIARAEQRGLVTREPAAEDARGIVVAMTAAGHAFTGPLVERTTAILEPLLEPLDADEREMFQALLVKTTRD